jgi:molybdopterin-guanine dinucleotide biosynthesis protein A
MEDERHHRPKVAGILLTGGASRRMGFEKASMPIDGTSNSKRLAQVLIEVANPVIEVGPGRSGLPAVVEDPPGSGPLAAIAAGVSALDDGGHKGPSLVVACDLPFVDEKLLDLLAGWPGDISVVPVVEGHPQPLCARWSSSDLASSAVLVASGERSMRVLVSRPGVVMLDETGWSSTVDGRAFSDVDTPADLVRLGLTLRWESEPGTRGS